MEFIALILQTEGAMKFIMLNIFYYFTLIHFRLFSLLKIKGLLRDIYKASFLMISSVVFFVPARGLMKFRRPRFAGRENIASRSTPYIN